MYNTDAKLVHTHDEHKCDTNTGWPQKSKPLPNDQKIVLKPVIEIIHIRQIKV